ncbi:hypothetical protein TNCV_4796471 [Trichonephila clavipes]|uniref:Uncharacterized protein n=1 Tax=Trichonephila clavipes TaxID=2585209 RepID=A0A8X6VDB1_TRICX|nr:hypothetical protein TNCV_4796471 [Trichonephila clavipes]
MSSFLVLCEGDTRNRWRDGQVCPDVGQGTMAPWARRPGCVLACDAQIGRGRPRDFCDLPIRRDEGRVVNTPLVFKRVLFQEKRKRKGGKKGGRKRRERGGDGKRKEGDGEREEKESGESERSPPWMEKRAESEIGVERR